VKFEGNIGTEIITKLISFIIATILTLGAILLLIIKKRELPVKNLDIQKNESEEIGFCKSCGAEILDKTCDFCSKCGERIK